MNGAERAALARSVGAVVTRVNRTVAETGTAVRAQVRTGLAPLGPAGALPMAAIDRQHELVHRLVAAGADATATAAAAGLALTTDPAAESLHDRPGATPLWAGARAAFGDVLPPALNPAIRLIPESSDDPSPGTAPRVVFLHGLGGHEEQWPEDYRQGFRRAGFEVLTVRYSTGRPIGDNGRELATALTAVTTDRSRICLVGHSMGGLVAAAALAAPESAPWNARVSDVVTLGTPFTGAPLERFARRALATGSLAPTAAPIVALGDHRSAGIKELGDGGTAALPEHVRHLAVVAVLGETPEALTSRLCGDGMVSPASATGPAPDRVQIVTRCSHVGLLSDPRVADLLAQVARSAPVPAAR